MDSPFPEQTLAPALGQLLVQDLQGPLLQPWCFYLQALRAAAATVNEVLNEVTGLALISLMPDLNLCNSINLAS